MEKVSPVSEVSQDKYIRPTGVIKKGVRAYLVERKCRMCHKAFLAPRFQIKMGNGVFCSRSCSCSFTHTKNKKMGKPKGWRASLETRIKQSLSKKGKPNKSPTKFKVGHIPWNWKGGTNSFIKTVRLLNKYKSWRTEVFRRDNYTCQDCRVRGGELDPHHIIPLHKLVGSFLKENEPLSLPINREVLLGKVLDYKLFWRVDNGRTLCRKCHRKTAGYGKSSRF